MKYSVERGVLRGLSVQKLKETLDDKNKNKPKEIPVETCWLELGSLNQDILDDVTAIYCQVFNIDPTSLNGTPHVNSVKRAIAFGPGFCEFKLANSNDPRLEVRRIKIDEAGMDGILIRFRSTSHPQKETFQKAVDGYLGEDLLHLAQPLSKVMGYMQGRA